VSNHDQGPEATEDTMAGAADPEAPFGRRKDGSPYKRDPGPFAHLRGRPFGSLNGQGGKAPAPRKAVASGKPRASVDGPLKHDAEGYAGKIARAFRGVASFLAPRAPVPAAIVAVRSADMAEAWGKVAVSYPKLGRLIDRMSVGGDLSTAVGSTLTTLIMVAHTGGYTKGLWFDDMIADAVQEALNEFATSAEHAAARARMEAKLSAAAEAHAAKAAGDGSAE